MKSALSVVSLENAGVAIHAGDNLWLIDAFHESGEHYQETSYATIRIIRRLVLEHPGSHVHLILTHLHPDHADPSQMERYAQYHGLSVYTFDPAIREWDLRHCKVYLLPKDKDYAIQGDILRGISLPHLSPAQNPLPHAAVLLRLGNIRVFLSGDGALDEACYQHNFDHIHGSDLAICCYPYAFTRRGDSFTETYISPGQLILNHFPIWGPNSSRTMASFMKHRQRLPLAINTFAFLREGITITL